MSNLNIALALSGGIDSTVALFDLLYERNYVWTMTIDYGQRNSFELGCSERIARSAMQAYPGYYQGHMMLSMADYGALIPGSCVTDPLTDPPRHHVAADDIRPSSIERVPFLTDLIVRAAAGYGVAHGCDQVVVGRVDGEVVAELADGEFEVEYRAMNYYHPVACGSRVLAPLHQTTSCIAPPTHLGAPLKPCGTCLGCVRRARKFRDAGLQDPGPTAHPEDSPEVS